MIQSSEVFSGSVTCWCISHWHKLGLGIAFVISMVILPLPPFTHYIPALFLSPPLFAISSLPLFLVVRLSSRLPPPSVFLSFLSQPITLSFLPWRQYYQWSASSKLHPESFLELEIGEVQRLRFRRWKGRACFTHQPAPVSRDFSAPSFLPPVLRLAVLSPLQHTPTPLIESHWMDVVSRMAGRAGPDLLMLRAPCNYCSLCYEYIYAWKVARIAHILNLN